MAGTLLNVLIAMELGRRVNSMNPEEYEKAIEQKHHELQILIAEYSDKHPANYMVSKWV